jgi:glycosyltransferase involved in cell wall biosynthesis
MRIAIYHNLPSGGAKRALFEWTQRLAADNALDAYTLSTADHAFCDIRPFVRQHRLYDFGPHHLFAAPLGRLNRLQRWRDLASLAQLGRRIARDIDAGGYDVVFAHPCQFTYLPGLLRFLEVPAVYYLHEPFGPGFVRVFRRPYQKRDTAWRRWSLRFDPFYLLYTHRLESGRVAGLARIACLLANSLFTQQQISREYGVGAEVCHYGVNTEAFLPLYDAREEGAVLSVGELTPRKGFAFLVESLAHIPPDQRPALRLACNGEIAAERRFVEALAVERGVELHILSSLDTTELNLEYNRAKLCVYAPVLEPFGLVPLESMACGTPVVGVREGGVRESVVDGVTGTLVDRDPMQFASAVMDLLADPERMARYGRQARDHVMENWTWDRSVAQLKDHLARTAESPGEARA